MDQSYEMSSPITRLRDHEWISPTSTKFCDPGDRFIPTRSLMNLDLAQAILMDKKPKKTQDYPSVLTPREEYKRRVDENLSLDSEGKPFKMLVFRGTPRSCRRRLLVDEMMQEEEDRSKPIRPIRRIPTSADRVLDAPDLIKDYYLNLMEWGKNNILAIALGLSLYLWNAATGKVEKLLHVRNENHHPSSVAWSDDGKTLAVGFASSAIELWDALSLRRVRVLKGHKERVGSLCWNHNILTSGSHDASIINHDVRSNGRSVSRFRGHTEEVCGLKWSAGGNLLASGGNDNLLHIWESSNMGSSKYLHRFSDHSAAVRALAWCPFQSNVLASGGGTSDRCIKIWNVCEGTCSRSIDSGSQVCALEWNRHQKEIISGLGFGQNHLSLWAYPSMSKIADLTGHTERVLHLSQSPDGSTVVSAGADETIRFWKVFEPPPSAYSRTGYEESDSPLSLKRLHIR